MPEELTQLLWTEKYRPRTLDDVVNQSDIVARLKVFVKEKNMPHLLFTGPPGVGKTTVALALVHDLYGEHYGRYVLEMNASDERGIDVIRTKVKEFARSVVVGDIPFKVVILDEADNMCLHPDTEVVVGTLDNMQVKTLRQLLEEYGEKEFDVPSLNFQTLRPENDRGHIVISGKADLYRVTLEDGRTILASAEHPFFQIRGFNVNIVRTKDLKPGTEIADFSNRILRCYNCGKIFYRHNPYILYNMHFCSKECRNAYIGDISRNRRYRVGRRRTLPAAAAMKPGGVNQSEEYRWGGSEVMERLWQVGRIPAEAMAGTSRVDLYWKGRKHGEEEGRKIGLGVIKHYREYPGVRELLNRRASEALGQGEGYRASVGGDLFEKTAHIGRARQLETLRSRGFRGLLEGVARMLDQLGVKYVRGYSLRVETQDRVFTTLIDFVVGNLAIFVKSCWWHCCPVCGVEPIYQNQVEKIRRDYLAYEYLEKRGYRILVIWEHELRDLARVKEKLYEALGIAGGHLPRIKHVRVKSVEYIGYYEVLNIHVNKNKNFFLANGVLTHNTSDAQQALRRLMEMYVSTTRFILMANYSSKIIEPIQSRCAIFRFSPLAREDVVGRLKMISDKEGVKYDPEALDAIYDITEGDMRRAINILQAAAALGKVTVSSVYKVVGLAHPKEVREMIQMALAGNFTEARERLRKIMIDYGLSGVDVIRQIHREAFDPDLKIDEDLRIYIADYAGEINYRLIEGADDEIQLNAFLARLVLLGKRLGGHKG